MAETSKAQQQRNRKDNFTHAEIIALIEAYGERKEVLQGRLKSSLSNVDKKKHGRLWRQKLTLCRRQEDVSTN